MFWQVLYDTNGFLEKNRDPLHSDSIQLLSSCRSELLQLFASKMLNKSQKQATSVGHTSALDFQKQSVGTKFKVHMLLRNFELDICVCFVQKEERFMNYGK